LAHNSVPLAEHEIFMADQFWASPVNIENLAVVIQNSAIGVEDAAMQRKPNLRYRAGERGNAVVEFTLLLPWLFMLFTAVFDFGFYAYALIAVENAVRVAALHGAANSVSAGDRAGACSLVVEELRGLPNINQSFTSSCDSDPVSVTAHYCDGTTACATGVNSADSGPAAYVSVTYQMPVMFRVPIQGVSRITRAAQMRLRDSSQ
jgi:Flp pilus assembly protein TadG